LVVLVTLSVLTIYLLFERKQLKQARREQTRLSGRLISAQEEERSRLASELHDDFSQRMAVLSLGLETAADMIPGSPEQANRQLHELMNSAGEIGADLHTLSHRLHSSTLERLGLASGVSAFCKEFTAQQGTQIACSYDDVPRAVSPDVALCLFRIVQEGLRNVKKHSEATHAQVRLKKLDGGLHLSISDNGKGFDPNGASEGQGLGLWSMKERVRLVEGRFEIHSGVHNGTRIEVWAPLKEKSDASPGEQRGNVSCAPAEGQTKKTS
jgi:signal transduction histidine kinase